MMRGARRAAVIAASSRNIIDEGQCGANAFWKLYSDGTLEISGTGGTNNYYNYNPPWFDYYEEITSLVVDEGITVLNDANLRNAASLISVDLPNSLTAIIRDCFRGCTSLEKINLPETLVEIDEGVFRNCTNLALTELPAGLTSIATNAFGGCTSLALTELPAGLTSIATNAFGGCTSLALTELPESLTKTGICAFINCTNLALTKLPNSIKEIGAQTFQSCPNIHITEIPNSVETLGGYIFHSNTAITEMKFFGRPNSISNNCFLYMNNLKDIYVPWAENEVANAPWGANRATIHYNWTGGTA